MDSQIKEEKRQISRDTSISRDSAMSQIADAVIYGNLGMFIGAGLPMAILNRPGHTVALSWGELIKKCFKAFRIPQNRVNKIGTSYPDVTTQLCKIIASKKRISYEAAVKILKEKIAELTCLYPRANDRQKYRQFMDILEPQWIITTNYDTVIESVMTGRCFPLSVDDQLVAPRNQIPVYHLHGIRTNPDSIVITQDDYVKLFRPNQYRQQKLPLTLKESFTLFVGYNLGDFNVLTAVDWTQNVFAYPNDQHPNKMVQLLYRTDYAFEPYYVNGILIIEFNKLSSVLQEICAIAKKRKEEYAVQLKKLKRYEAKYLNPSEELVKKFVENSSSRKTILRLLKESNHFFINGFLELLSKSNDLAWSRTKPNNAFEAYNDNLKLLMDIIENLEIKNAPPALIEMLTYNLYRLSDYIGPNRGQSYSAFTTWKKRLKKLPHGVVKEMMTICHSQSYHCLTDLLKLQENTDATETP